MEQNLLNSNDPPQDEQAYQWLDENTRLIRSLKPDQNAEIYTSTLLKMVFEGQKQLARAKSEDAVLVCYLNLLLAEAQVDLALIEKGVSTRKMFVTEGCEYCQQAMANLDQYGVSGLACRALPRMLTILTAAYQAASVDQHAEVEASLKKAADLLDEFKIQQTYERQKAVDKLLEGRILALSTAEIPNPGDRRQVLEKAAACLRQASGFSGLAFDDVLAKQAGETLAEIVKSLADESLPVPVLPMPAGLVHPIAVAASPAEMAEEATLVKSRPWMMGIESGPLKGQRFPLGEQLRIGRSLDNDLVLTDKEVSRKHALIERAGDGYQVSDLGSGNGTLVNEVAITQPTALKPGDEIQIGETHIAVLGPAGTAPLPVDEPTQMKAGAGAFASEYGDALANQASKLCPQCGAPLKPSARFCGSCGNPIAAVEETAELKAAEAQEKKCPNCGYPVMVEVLFCKKCGWRL